jgi:hypothetical protein
VSRRPAPPGGWPPPPETTLGGVPVDLNGLARAVSDRYFERYPEDLERYGELAREWEIHDTQHLLNWAIGDVEGFVDLEHQVAWLAGVLEARDFPVEHLAGNLELAADVVAEQLAGGAPVADRLRAAADAVRRRPPAAPR